MLVGSGRTELQLPECPAPLLQGWRAQATGVLRRPLPAVHPLLPGSAERLARQGSWSQLRVGHQRWQLVPSPQALWALQQRQRSEPRQLITGTWLGFKPSAPQRRWLRKHGAGARFVGL